MDTTTQEGWYLLRTSLEESSELLIWKVYNTIREIEATFRVLKNDLDLRPIYHKTDEPSIAHLHLGLLAYWIVNKIRYQFKQKGSNKEWKEIVRIMNTQKLVTTTMKGQDNQAIKVVQCNKPSKEVAAIYEMLKYKSTPVKKRKFVVPPQTNRKTLKPMTGIDFQLHSCNVG